MALPRALYIATYVLFLVTLIISLWFVLHYTDVPPWVWTFFAVGLAIPIIGIIIKETLIKYRYDENGELVLAFKSSFWAIFFIIAHLLAFGLIITGIVLVIIYSNVPWWIWLILGIGVILSIVNSMIIALLPNTTATQIISWILSVTTIGLYVAGVVLFVIYSNAPWWVWLLLGLALVLGVLANIFETYSDPNLANDDDDVYENNMFLNNNQECYQPENLCPKNLNYQPRPQNNVYTISETSNNNPSISSISRSYNTIPSSNNPFSPSVNTTPSYSSTSPYSTTSYSTPRRSPSPYSLSVDDQDNTPIINVRSSS